MKIAILSKDKPSAVSYYRVVPMLELCRAKNWEAVQIKPQDFTFDVTHYFDILFCHRPGSDAEIAAIANAKFCGCKVWLDLDDLLWKIPISNDAVQHYNPRVHDCLLQGMMNADVVTCSTESLSEEIYKEFGKSAIIVNNAWNDRPGSDHIEQPKKREIKKILYRGSNTHRGDLYQARAAFEHYENIEWHFFGAMPDMMLKEYGGHLEKVHINTWTSSVRNYFETLYAIAPDYVIFPLENNLFNKCKSNIAWIEATQAGAVCIAPDYMPEFSRVPMKPYNTIDELKNIIEHINNDNSGHQQFLHGLAVEKLKSDFALSKINNIRLQIAANLAA